MALNYGLWRTACFIRFKSTNKHYVINEEGFDTDVIKTALAHVDKNEIRRAYKSLAKNFN